MYKRICAWCSKEYETDDIDNDYCSLECYHAEEEDYTKSMDELFKGLGI